MVDDELRIISELSGASKKNIRFSDDGFLSRGYVIDDGRIVFKFKKSPSVSYKNEIKMLNFLNSLDFDINLQKVGWISDDDSYIGVYGIVGKSLESINLTDEKRKDYGKQIGLFLKKLHLVDFSEAEKLTVREELDAWRQRFESSKEMLSRFFEDAEIEVMDDFINSFVSDKLIALGEKMVFSHGDLGMGNIFVDDKDKIGIIDFSESVYLDEAADFMDIEDDGLCAEILDTYGADGILREKVAIRRDARPMFVIGTYKNRPEEEIQNFVDRIRKWLITKDWCGFRGRRSR